MQKSDLRQRNYSGEGVDVDAVFASLSDRERLIGSLLNRTNSQRGLPPLDGLDLAIRIRDCAPVLEVIPAWALDHCFTRAVQLHDYRHPFQIGEVVKIWSEMSETTRQQLYERHALPALAAGPPCEWCNGTGMMRVLADGEAVKFASRADTDTVARCVCRKARVR